MPMHVLSVVLGAHQGGATTRVFAFRQSGGCSPKSGGHCIRGPRMPSNLDVLSSSLLGVLDQQARMLLVLSAHAQALSASEEDVRISKLLVKCTEDDASASLRSAVKIIQTRQDQLSTWMEAILSTARMHRERATRAARFAACERDLQQAA